MFLGENRADVDDEFEPSRGSNSIEAISAQRFKVHEEGENLQIISDSLSFGEWRSPLGLGRGELYRWRENGGETDNRVWVNDGDPFGMGVEISVATIEKNGKK